MGLGETEAFREKIAASINPDTSPPPVAAGRETSEKFQNNMLVRTIASIVTGLAVWPSSAQWAWSSQRPGACWPLH